MLVHGSETSLSLVFLLESRSQAKRDAADFSKKRVERHRAPKPLGAELGMWHEVALMINTTAGTQ